MSNVSEEEPPEIPEPTQIEFVIHRQGKPDLTFGPEGHMGDPNEASRWFKKTIKEVDLSRVNKLEYRKAEGSGLWGLSYRIVEPGSPEAERRRTIPRKESEIRWQFGSFNSIFESAANQFYKDWHEAKYND